jgi:hypothetical protein
MSKVVQEAGVSHQLTVRRYLGSKHKAMTVPKKGVFKKLGQGKNKS